MVNNNNLLPSTINEKKKKFEKSFFELDEICEKINCKVMQVYKSSERKFY